MRIVILFLYCNQKGLTIEGDELFESLVQFHVSLKFSVGFVLFLKTFELMSHQRECHLQMHLVRHYSRGSSFKFLSPLQRQLILNCRYTYRCSAPVTVFM